MTERQQTGVWFVVTRLLLLSLWFLSYAIISAMINLGYFTNVFNISNLTNEQQFALGYSATLSVQLISFTGIPFLITGIAQILSGVKKKASKK